MGPEEERNMETRREEEDGGDFRSGGRLSLEYRRKVSVIYRRGKDVD